MKLKDAMKFEINEDVFASLTDPDSGLTDEQKQAFLEAVSGFNNFNKSIYREQNLKDITNDIVKIGKLAEKYIMAEQDDWFDGISVKRDMKSLQESIKMFESTAKEVAVLQQRLESVYEEVGTKLGKYFEINDIVQEDTKLSSIVQKNKVTEGKMKELMMSIEDAFEETDDPKKVAKKVAKEMGLKEKDVLIFAKQYLLGV